MAAALAGVTRGPRPGSAAGASMVGSDDDEFYNDDGGDGDGMGDGGGGPECKAKRVLANRQSAQRSRQRKLHFIASLDASATGLAVEIEGLAPALAEVRREAAVAVADHARLVAALEAGLALAERADAAVAAAVAGAGGPAAAASAAGGPPPVLGELPPLPPPPPPPEVMALPPPPPPAAYALAVQQRAAPAPARPPAAAVLATGSPAPLRPGSAGLPPRPATAAVRRTAALPPPVLTTPAAAAAPLPPAALPPTLPDPTSPTALGAAFRAGGGGALTPGALTAPGGGLDAASPLPRSMSPLDFADVVVAGTPSHAARAAGAGGVPTTPCGAAAGGGVSPFAFGGDGSMIEPMSPVDFGAEAF